MSSSNTFKTSLARRAVDAVSLPNGGLLLKSPQALGPYARCIGDLLKYWAQTSPDHVFLAERSGERDWRKVTYGEAYKLVRSIGQGLVARGLSAQRPVVTLSANSIDLGMLLLGAMHAGIPITPVTPAYGLGPDYSKLRYVFDLLEPGLIYVSDGEVFSRALSSVPLHGAEVVVSHSPAKDMRCTVFSDLCATQPGREIDEAFLQVGHDTVAKIMLTSGSTGMPKGVITTQRMMCSNLQANSQIFYFFSENRPVLVDWFPWSHVAGGNYQFNMTIRHGGCLYIDDGRPMPVFVEKTIRNLSEISPTNYASAPLGYGVLLPYLEGDERLRKSFFRRLDSIVFSGAAMPRNHWEHLHRLAIQTCGHPVLISGQWGCTETAPSVTTVYFQTDCTGNLGLPLPGCELRLVPKAGKLELRVRGPNVTPGYWKQPELTKAAFDEDGYFLTGDAGKLVNPNDPSDGLEFDGRISEDFKLTSGTWVSVGKLRVRAIAAGAPVIQDVVVTGLNRDSVGLIVFPHEAACRNLCPDVPPNAPLSALIADNRVRKAVKDALERLAAESTGSSTRPTRAIIMDRQPSMARNEITDKAYINQRAVLENCAALVDRLYHPQLASDVILLGAK